MSGGGPGGRILGGGGGGGKLERSISPVADPSPLEMRVTLLAGKLETGLDPPELEPPGEELTLSLIGGPTLGPEPGVVGVVGVVTRRGRKGRGT